MTRIKLMPDYNCYPLWKIDDDNFGNISSYSLPLSKTLADDLIEWAKEYDTTLNMNNPLVSGFKSKEEDLVFNMKGQSLYERLKLELGDQYIIEKYFY